MSQRSDNNVSGVGSTKEIKFDHLKRKSLRVRRLLNHSFMAICIGIAGASVLILAVLLTSLGYMGLGTIFNVSPTQSADADGAQDTEIEAPEGAEENAEPASSNAGLNTKFLTNLPSDEAEEAGIGPAFVGTIWVCVLCAFITLPLGVATAIFLEEFKPKKRFLGWVHAIIQLNISNLAGVPSVVYGIIGLTAFVYVFGLFEVRQNALFEIGADYRDQFRSVYRGEQGQVHILSVPVKNARAEPVTLEPGMKVRNPQGEQVEVNLIQSGEPIPREEELQKRTVKTTEKASRFSETHWYHFRIPIGRGILAGSLTLMLVILPVVIIASQEAIRAVPSSLREAALGLGCTPWQVVRNVTLPASIPGIMTGSILAMSRAIGEAAPMLIIAPSAYISFFPGSVVDNFSVLPIQIYFWATKPQEPFHYLAAGGIIVLLAVLLSFNGIAILIRQLTQKPLS